MEMATRIQRTPEMIDQVQDAIKRADKEQRGRPKKMSHFQQEDRSILKNYNELYPSPGSWLPNNLIHFMKTQMLLKLKMNQYT
jgi:hypothetical protein